MSNKNKNDIFKYQEQEYFCSKCKHYHRKGSHIYTMHYEQKANLTKSQLFREIFKSKWNKTKSDIIESNQKRMLIN